MSAVLHVLRSPPRLRSAEALLLLILVLFILQGWLWWGVEAVGVEPLQQCSHSLGFGQLGDFEVLLVVWRVLSDQPLLLREVQWPLVFFVTPLAILSFVFVVLLPTSDDGLFCKVHSWLQRKADLVLVFHF